MIKIKKEYFIYGCSSKEEYQFVTEERENFNHKVWRIVTFLSSIYFIILFCTTFSVEAVHPNAVAYALMIAVTVLTFILLRTVAKPGSKLLMPTIYFMAFSYLLFGIFIGVVTSTEFLAATYHVLMLGIILITVDKPYYMTILETISTGIFIILCLMMKTGETRSLDIYNAITFFVVAQCINYYMVNNHMNQFLLAKKVELSSQTDKLTDINNRNAYEMDMLDLSHQYIVNNCVYVSIDVNGLKRVNDTLGHAAGDELLKGAAKCIARCFSQYGKVYRVGGDEFVAIVYASDEEMKEILNNLHRMVSSWKGNYIDNISLAVGYASKRELPDLTMEDLSKLADSRMYEDKKRYYQYVGVDRRGQQAAFDALCFSCKKILQVNLTTDTYHVIQMDDEEYQNGSQSISLSEWLYKFGLSQMVHVDDRVSFLEKTSLEYLKRYFQSGKNSIHIFYKRQDREGNYYQCMMELIVKNDYSDQNQELFLYVKNIDL